MKPILIVIAGPNGAGKTTVTERIRRDHWSDGVTYLNPDDVARDRFGELPKRIGVIDRLVLTGDLAAHGQPAVYKQRTKSPTHGNRKPSEISAELERNAATMRSNRDLKA